MLGNPIDANHSAGDTAGDGVGARQAAGRCVCRSSSRAAKMLANCSALSRRICSASLAERSATGSVPRLSVAPVHIDGHRPLSQVQTDDTWLSDVGQPELVVSDSHSEVPLPQHLGASTVTEATRSLVLLHSSSLEQNVPSSVPVWRRWWTQ